MYQNTVFFLIKHKLLISGEKMIHLFFKSYLGQVQLCQVSSMQDKCDRFSERGPFSLLSVSSPEKVHLE